LTTPVAINIPTMHVPMIAKPLEARLSVCTESGVRARAANDSNTKATSAPTHVPAASRCAMSAARWSMPRTPSSMAPCPAHASVASAMAPDAASPIRWRRIFRRHAIPTMRLAASTAMRTSHAAPTAVPVKIMSKTWPVNWL